MSEDRRKTQALCSLPIARRLPIVAVIAGVFVASAAAEDAVYLSSGQGERGYTKIVGSVVDYTGEELRLRLPGGSQQKFPANRVLRIETQYTAQQVEADARFARREFASALALYDQARAREERVWVRRGITAQMVWCARAVGDLERAGREFLVLFLSDPNTPYFDCIPLAWVPRAPSGQLERTARQWLGQNQTPAAVLLGASHLMTTALRPQALDQLKALTTASDRRIAFLAYAQTWRAEVVTANEQKVETWRQTVERMPESLRSGPYYVLGLALGHRQAWEEAALAWLRIPILYPEHRHLAAQSLLDAGRSLEKLGRSKQAAPLFGEVIQVYSETSAAAEARSRLDEAVEDTER